ncbi:MAG TPA: hypothetical protein VL547_14010 [Dinghuibacter sp.]|jgi:hypothetical protein|uniref:hypothetical protein n=1 Tax=Dinghuibacter sp. TaxID=2024697 RepID=UPI002C13F78F|nr:hypothetical protein [Dinghuibacter sp.]HTJ13144.1 hypothetical protein [Dinghuibacter sp.]
MPSSPVVQRAKIKTGTSVRPGGTKTHTVEDLAVLDALTKKVSDFGKGDFPQPARIESASNAGRINRDPSTELGDERKLGDRPIDDLWQLVLDYKKSRFSGAVNVKDKDGGELASLKYNQYGSTSRKWENDDVMVYKTPKGLNEEKEITDTSVAYKMGATKFETLRTDLGWTDQQIAKAVLKYIKDGVVPAEITGESRRNFGYLVALMTVPESVRGLGTFPLGLIQLDNIATGAITSAKALAGPADDTEEEEDEYKYKKELRAGGAYAPAFAGSKQHINEIERANDAGKPLKAQHASNETKYTWNLVLDRYTAMIKTFLGKHPELLGVGPETDDKKVALNGLVGNMLAFLGIGPQITGATSDNRVLGRTMSTALHTLNKTDLSEHKLTGAFLGSETKSFETLTTSFSNYKAAPSSPSYQYPEFLSGQTGSFAEQRAERKDDEERGKLTGFHTYFSVPGQVKEEKTKKRLRQVVRESVEELEGGEKEDKKAEPETTTEPKKRVRFGSKGRLLLQLSNEVGLIVAGIAGSLTDQEFDLQTVGDSVFNSAEYQRIRKELEEHPDMGVNPSQLDKMLMDKLEVFQS